VDTALYIVGNITGKAKHYTSTLDKLVRQSLGHVTKDEITAKIDAWKCLSPGYPNPTFRYSKVIK
jgi:hypothetical protein